MKEYGEMLKEQRKRAGLTQQQVGEACGYEGISAQRTVGYWESGRSYPPLDKLRVLAKALGVTLESLIPYQKP